MNPLHAFVEQATTTLDLASTRQIEQDKLVAYGESQRRRRFLKDPVARVRVVEASFDRLDDLTRTMREINRRWEELPHERGTRTIPADYVK